MHGYNPVFFPPKCLFWSFYTFWTQKDTRSSCETYVTVWKPAYLPKGWYLGKLHGLNNIYFKSVWFSCCGHIFNPCQAWISKGGSHLSKHRRMSFSSPHLSWTKKCLFNMVLKIIYHHKAFAVQLNHHKIHVVKSQHFFFFFDLILLLLVLCSFR